MNYNEEIALIDLFDDYSRWETAGEDTVPFEGLSLNMALQGCV